jgi:hypothetical protein
MVQRVPRLGRRLQGPEDSEWDEWRAEAEEYVELGDYLVVLARYHGRGRGSGIEISQEGAHVFKLRNDRVVRLEIFASRERALESVHAALADEQAAVPPVTPGG